MPRNELNFQEIHDEFRPRILRYLIRLIGSGEAEDLTQEVLAKISQALQAFRGESQLSTWIYQIATHSALDKIRSRSIRYLDQAETIEGNEEDQDAWTGEKPHSLEAQVIREEMNACIRSVVDQLPENYRTVIVLSELEGLPDQEMAEVLGLSLEAAKIRLHRARTRLKEDLARHCVFYRTEQNELACDPKGPFPMYNENDKRKA
jgi:RNA polymerase sigma-70 factor, ECF subfamily